MNGRAPAPASFDLLGAIRTIVDEALERFGKQLVASRPAEVREPPLTVAAAAERAGIPQDSLRKSIERGTVAGVLRGPGRRVRIDWAEFSKSRDR